MARGAGGSTRRPRNGEIRCHALVENHNRSRRSRRRGRGAFDRAAVRGRRHGGRRRAALLPACRCSPRPRAGAGPYGPLQPPNEAGLMLPQGFTGRQIARGGRPVGGTLSLALRHRWRGYLPHDRQRLCAVSNSETLGCRRRSLGHPLRRRRRHRAGLPDPGGHEPQLCRRPDALGHMALLRGARGRDGWEADPAGILPAVPRPALGNFSHEAAAVDPCASRCT